jgi:putative endonuclease
MSSLQFFTPLLRGSDWLRHQARLRKWNKAHAWGRRGEDLAHRFLQRQGYCVVARNLKLRGVRAELDIVARYGDIIVFVEVKTRASDEFGMPEEAVDAEKREHLIRAASAYLHSAGARWERARFDIITVLFEGTTKIEQIVDAFSYSESQPVH